MTSVPTKAVWVDGKKGKGKVLIDMAGFRLRYKKKDGGKKYFICPRKEDTQCMVSVTLDIESDMIVLQFMNTIMTMTLSKSLLKR